MTSRKRVVAILVCTILACASIGFWQMNQSAHAALSPYSSRAGLVGWWRFNEGTGSIAGDSSQYGNTGTVYNAEWTTGKFGQALSFDGVSSRVQISDAISLRLTNQFTIAFWIKSGTLSQSEKYIVAKSNDYAVIYGYSSNQIEFYAQGIAGSDPRPNSQISITDTQWHHMAYTYDGSTWSGYEDSVQIFSIQRSFALINTASPLTIGTSTPTGLNPYNGLLDEVQIYSRALSYEEVKLQYENPNFSSGVFAAIPKGTTQVITTISWQGTGSINLTITSPSHTYTEEEIPVYQKSTYSTSEGMSNMLTVKRVSVSVSALSSDQKWHILLNIDAVENYRIVVETQK